MKKEGSISVSALLPHRKGFHPKAALNFCLRARGVWLRMKSSKVHFAALEIKIRLVWDRMKTGIEDLDRGWRLVPETNFGECVNADIG